MDSGTRTFGLLLCAFNCGVSCLFLVWTIINRKSDQVKVAQPIFLWMMGVGSIVSTLAIIPMSLSEDDAENLATEEGHPTADGACMATVWLYGLGFVMTFSPLFAKVWRVERIFDAGLKMKRKFKLTTRMVITRIAFAVLIDFVILGIWTAVSPLKYVRRDTVVDPTTQIATESVGACESTYAWYFFGPLIVWHVVLLVIGCFFAYRARNIASKFAETQYIFLALMSNLQVLVLAVP